MGCNELGRMDCILVMDDAMCFSLKDFMLNDGVVDDIEQGKTFC